MTGKAAVAFNQPFSEQVDFFKDKINLPSRYYDDILKDAHDRAFIVAGATKADLLDDLRTAVDKAVMDGGTLSQFQKDFDNIVAKHGWIYNGERDWRTQVIYKTNISASYAAGRWQQLNDPDLLSVRPYWQYHHKDGQNYPRPLHVAWSGTVLKYDDPWWKTHFAPNGWGCECWITAVRADKYKGDPAPSDGTYTHTDRRGITHTIPNGIDYGWDYAPGASISKGIKAATIDKAAAFPKPLSDALLSDVAKLSNQPIRSQFETARDYVLSNGRKNAAKSTEFAYSYDADGTFLFKKRGGKSHVNFSSDEMALLRSAANPVLIHNHPGGSSLSRPDLLLSHSINGEIIAIGHNDIEYYGKIIDFEGFQSIYSSLDKEIHFIFFSLINSGAINIDQANLFRTHITNVCLREASAIMYRVNSRINMPEILNSVMIKLLDKYGR